MIAFLFHFRRQLFSDVFLVTNADKYKHFERWATASDFPVENIINDGSTILDNALGSVADVELAIRTKNLWENDILVVAGDMLFQVYVYYYCYSFIYCCIFMIYYY